MGGDYGKGLYKQYEDTMALLEKLNAKMEKMEADHKAEIAALKEDHRREVAALKEEIRVRDVKIAELTKKNEALTEEVTRLKSILNNDSNNSSNPPSTGQKPSEKKANTYNSRQKSGKKPGGQKNSHTNTLTHSDIQKLLEAENCKHIIKNIGHKVGKYISRYVVDVEVVPVVTEYRYYEGNKPFSPSEVIYGNRLKAIVLSLYSIGGVANDRIAELIHSLTNGLIRIATGTVYRFCRDFSVMSCDTLDHIETCLLNQNAVYTDATNVSINGKQSFVRNVSSDVAARYYAMERKTKEEIEAVKTLQNYSGVMVHDHETTLYQFLVPHAECNVHILRYLEKNTQDTSNSWSGKMKEFFTKANKKRKTVIAADTTFFTAEEISALEKEYDEILALGEEQNAATKPRWAKKDERRLLNRLKKYRVNHLLFLHRFDVKFDNNLSERDLRKCKIRQKMSGGFRTLEGCKMFCNILSVVETAKRRGLSAFSTITQILNGQALFAVNG